MNNDSKKFGSIRFTVFNYSDPHSNGLNYRLNTVKMYNDSKINNL